MKRLLLDLCCRRGGAGEGYRRAGFEVHGFDIDKFDYPPGPFLRRDALTVMGVLANTGQWRGRQVSAVHISPPCQRWATGTRNPERHPDLITPSQRLLDRWVDRFGGVYVIENVPNSPLREPAMLCGSMFDLGVKRHRHFESNVDLAHTLKCDHVRQGRAVGVYGDHPDSREFFRPDGSRRGAKATSVEQARLAMGIDWMEWKDLAESIPPAYTEHIGSRLLESM